MRTLSRKFIEDFHLNAPATNAAIDIAEKHFACSLPEDYKQLLLCSNGFEGNANDNYLVLWSIEELVTLNEAYNVKEFISDVIIFGSDGGEEAFAFDYSSEKTVIVKLPFIGMRYIVNEKIADSLREFMGSQIREKKTFLKGF
jgi:hypothetical protein